MKDKEQKESDRSARKSVQKGEKCVLPKARSPPGKKEVKTGEAGRRGKR